MFLIRRSTHEPAKPTKRKQQRAFDEFRASYNRLLDDLCVEVDNGNDVRGTVLAIRQSRKWAPLGLGNGFPQFTRMTIEAGTLGLPVIPGSVLGAEGGEAPIRRSWDSPGDGLPERIRFHWTKPAGVFLNWKAPALVG